MLRCTNILAFYSKQTGVVGKHTDPRQEVKGAVSPNPGGGLSGDKVLQALVRQTGS